MFRNVLVAIDGSEHSEVALKEAGDLAAAAQAKLTLITCFKVDTNPAVSAWSTGMTVDEMNVTHDIRRRIAEHAAAFMERARSQVPPGVSCETLVVEDHPPQGILAQIRAGGHDLVVLGSRGHGPISSLFLGSVSQNVLHHSPVPVLIVRIAHDAAPESSG